MSYQQPCATSACHQAEYTHQGHGYPHTQPIWSAVPQYHYGYEQHTMAPPVAHTFVQASAMSPNHTSSAEPVVGGQNGYTTVPPGQHLLYRDGVEIDYGQPTTPMVEFNVDELLEYQRRRSSATSEEKEPLTPAQRRRKAQNRAASPTLLEMVRLLTRRGGHSQRAFRDRKRQRVQDLEVQLTALEIRTSSLESDNEKLKHELLRTREENELLRTITRPQLSGNTLQLDQRRPVTRPDKIGKHLPAE
ncbi:hypothetical protein E4T43_00713 [Aureobasidium subglaciale]|nr:hypothetical protein E4T43_00713 [Aureobasidium subglaciale]